MRRAPPRRLMMLAAMLYLAWIAPTPAAAQADAQAERPPTPVTVVTLKAQDATITSTLPGRVVAAGVAEVRPQVDGLIVERLFQEGTEVKIGDPLYQIDAAIYEAQVAAAKAQVAEAQARVKASMRDAERLQRLQGRNVVSEQSLDTAIAERDAAAAALEVAKAELQSAVINLDRTTVRAPLSGVIGRSLTTQGALVTASQIEPLAIIRQLDPVSVDVTQSAAEMIAWRRGDAVKRLANTDKTVKLILADGGEYEYTGSVTAAEPHVDLSTGVITLRLQFPNPDAILIPGMYIQVLMPQGVAYNVVLAPQEGVTRDRRGRPIAYVVNDDNVVEMRELNVIRAVGSDWIVSDGLKDGDRIIVEGLQKIAPQAKVKPEERAQNPAGPDHRAARNVD
jgi:membrane fusion protein, multidrug efflux system